jgi:hypothetical protein
MAVRGRAETLTRITRVILHRHRRNHAQPSSVLRESSRTVTGRFLAETRRDEIHLPSRGLRDEETPRSYMHGAP